jgi:peptidyl-prolyl cis-trans isomerase SurA
MLVEREILYQEAQERKMTVTDPEIEDAWKRQLDILQKGFARGKDRVPSEEEVLKQAGTTREEALTELRKALLIEKSRAEIVKERGIAVSDTDVAQYYEANKERAKQPEQVHLKQIVVMGGAIPGAASPRSRDEARARAEDALRRIRAGHSFESVAKAVSDGPERDKGGDLGPRAAWGLPAPFVAAARAMKPGEVSNVIEGTVGFHLIKLVEIISGSEVTLEEATPSIRRLLLAEKGAKAVKEFCRDIAEQPEAVEVYLQLDQQILAHPELAEQLGAG